MIYWEITFDPNCSENCVFCGTDRATTFPMPCAKLDVPVVTLSTQNNTTLLQQLKEQLIEINTNQKNQEKPKINI